MSEGGSRAKYLGRTNMGQLRCRLGRCEAQFNMCGIRDTIENKINLIPIDSNPVC